MPSPLIETVGGLYVGIAIVCSLAALPFLRRSVPRNHLCGYRISAAMQSPEAWYAINEYAARRSLLYHGALCFIGLMLILLSRFVDDFQTGTDCPWQIIVGLIPLQYVFIRPLWEASQWANRPHRDFAHGKNGIDFS